MHFWTISSAFVGVCWSQRLVPWNSAKWKRPSCVMCIDVFQPLPRSQPLSKSSNTDIKTNLLQWYSVGFLFWRATNVGRVAFKTMHAASTEVLTLQCMWCHKTSPWWSMFLLEAAIRRFNCAGVQKTDCEQMIFYITQNCTNCVASCMFSKLRVDLFAMTLWPG